VGERGVEVAGLQRNPPLPVRRQKLERPHVVQAVGELDQDDAGVLGNREEQLPVVLDLPLLGRVERKVADLGEAVDDFGYLFSELCLYFVDADASVLYYVVDESTGDGDRIQLQINQDLRDLDAMRYVLVPGKALLPFVRPLAEAIGARKQVAVEPFRKALHDPCWKRFFLDCAGRHNSPASAKLI
jgi:hypothetical protein